MNFFKGRKKNKPLFLCEPYVSATLVNGSFKKISQLPHGVDPNEWVAANTVDFCNYIQQFYSIVSEYCDAQTCPSMQGGREEYYWMDSQKKPLKLPANQYVDFAQNWMQSVIMDETIFPTKNGSPFPPNFASVVRSIFRQLFRILDHIYHNHYEILLHVSAEQHLNTLAAHLICFSKEYDLIDKKEMLPMQEFQQLYESLGRI